MRLHGIQHGRVANMSNNMPLNNPYAPLPNQNLSNQGLPNQSYPGQGSSNQGMPNIGYATFSGLPMGFREVDKVLYVVLTFFIGNFGVHRFLRGQVGIGILMLLCNWMTLGLWWLIDFVIALVKLGQYPGDKFIFDANGNWAYMQ